MRKLAGCSPDHKCGEGIESLYETTLIRAEKSPSALSLMKSLLYQTDGLTLEKAIESGVYANALARMTDDARQGFERFLKKR